MKLLSFTICCFILQIRSQFNSQQYYYPYNGYVPLSANSGQIDDRFTRDSITQNGYIQNKEAIDAQSVNQRVRSDSASGPNPANFNLWDKKPDNSVPYIVNRNGADLNRLQDQGVTNDNQASLNQNTFNTQNENVPIRDEELDLSILSETSSQTPTSTIEDKTQVPVNQNVNGLFGLAQNEGTLSFTKPKIDFIGPSVTHFGINLLKAFGDIENENILISPLSISTCLGLLQQGAHGVTESQISNALRLSPESSRVAYKSIADDIKKRSSVINILRTANNIFMTKNFKLNANFSSIAQKDFRSTVSTLDYSQPILAANEINKWVAAQTNNKITQLVSPQHVGPTTQMSLVNAVYFKGLWEVKFSEARTKILEFQLSNGQTKKVPFMRTRRYLRGAIEPASDAMIMIMPFKNEEYSLMWILPPQNQNLNEFTKTLTADQLLEFREFPVQEFDVEVPRFTIKTNSNLIPALTKMGISEIFGPYADLSGIGSNNRHSSPLSVSSALHSAVLSIDEYGGSAAASTSFGAVALINSTPLKFKANRPFLVILWDHASATPLCMAKIFEPSENDL